MSASRARGRDVYGVLVRPSQLNPITLENTGSGTYSGHPGTGEGFGGSRYSSAPSYRAPPLPDTLLPEGHGYVPNGSGSLTSPNSQEYSLTS